jgi:hypothetical protein
MNQKWVYSLTFGSTDNSKHLGMILFTSREEAASVYDRYLRSWKDVKNVTRIEEIIIPSGGGKRASLDISGEQRAYLILARMNVSFARNCIGDNFSAFVNSDPSRWPLDIRRWAENWKKV